MYIKRVEIENIKSHASSSFEFGRGTTAITGENGAGKTTIIEAVAWVLFDLLDYKKEVFLRQGAARGSVRVTFESGLDEREYVVYRDTGTAYNVMDPRLGRRIADKKDEVYRFLWQHMGLEPGTDLKSLFREAIGVPQGTFTAIFLQGGAQRKVAFDRLLKVEEYRQAADKLRDTAKFVDANVAEVREGIARAEGELTRAPLIEDEHTTHAKLAAELSTALEVLRADLAGKRNMVADLDEQQQRLAALQTERDRLTAEREKSELLLSQAEQAVKRSTEAAERVASSRPEHERHLAALDRLKELERERIERDRLRGELAKNDAAIVNVEAERKAVNEALEAISKAHIEIQTLQPKTLEQAEAEQALDAQRQRLALARAAKERLDKLQPRLLELRERYRENKDQLAAAAERSEMAAELTTLEARTGELMQSLATLQAGLERDQKFQSEIRNGLCPILSQKCLNLKEGETLESFVKNQFTDLTSQITDLRSEQTRVNERLVLAREAAKAAAAVDALRKRQTELEAEGTRLRSESESASTESAALPEIEQAIATAETRLKILDDPRGRLRQLDKEIAREPVLREQLSKAEANLERLESERKQLVEALDEYKELDAKWGEFSTQRDSTAAAHRVFLTSEADAAALTERQAERDAASAALANATAAAQQAESGLQSFAASYDRSRHEAARAALLDLERRHADTAARHDAAHRRQEQLANELAHFAKLRDSLIGEFREKERLENVAEVTAFIRETLKEAAPRVARNYVYHVSLEANQMFREISGNAERTLRWTEDYSIVLEEGGFERPFASLSGGEQMAAALAVRLALLKQLTDVRIAFFDEPTTNMDAERRENFAMQISRITHFDQLFVISHDETFDNYVDNIVSVGH